MSISPSAPEPKESYMYEAASTPFVAWLAVAPRSLAKRFLAGGLDELDRRQGDEP